MIRPRTATDLPGCAQLLRLVHERDRYPLGWPDDPVAWLTEAATTASWVAVDGTDVLGHVAIRQDAERSDRLEIVRLFSHPDRRGSGIGRALTDQVLDHASGRGSQVWLEVVASSTESVAFYERTGWRRTGEASAGWTAPDGTHPTLIVFERDTGLRAAGPSPDA